MAYEKQTWQTGDTITAEKLNHMEDGIADGDGSVFILTRDDDDGTLYLANEVFDSDKKYTACYAQNNVGTPVPITGGFSYFISFMCSPTSVPSISAILYSVDESDPLKYHSRTFVANLEFSEDD